MRFLSSLIGLVFLVSSAYADTLLEDLNGSTIPLSSLQGKWVFINYWASWCGPCLEEIAELNRFYAQNKSAKVEVFAVNYDRMPTSEQRYLVRKFSIHYPSLKKHSLASLHLGDTSVVPVTYVLNPTGKLTTVLYGGQTLDSLNAVVSDLEQPSKQHV